MLQHYIKHSQFIVSTTVVKFVEYLFYKIKKYWNAKSKVNTMHYQKFLYLILNYYTLTNAKYQTLL